MSDEHLKPETRRRIAAGRANLRRDELRSLIGEVEAVRRRLFALATSVTVSTSTHERFKDAHDSLAEAREKLAAIPADQL